MKNHLTEIFYAYMVYAQQPHVGSPIDSRRVGPFRDRREAERAATALAADPRRYAEIYIAKERHTEHTDDVEEENWLAIPEALHRAAVVAAKRDDRSLTRWILRAMRAQLARETAADAAQATADEE